MHQVAHLLAGSPKARVAQLLAKIVGSDPQRIDALIDFAPLAGARNYTASIDQCAQVLHRAVLLHKELRCQLCRTVYGAELRRVKRFRYTVFR